MSDGEKLEQIGHAMMLAWGRIKKSQARMWGEWMIIGEGLLEGRRWAMQQAGTNNPEGKGYVMAYAEWLKRFKVDDMDKSDRAKLLQLMEERPGVEEWRATLTDYERRNLNNPTIAWRKWTAATRVKKPKPRTAGVSATEMGRARATVEQQQARIEELEEELAAVHATAGEPVAKQAENAEHGEQYPPEIGDPIDDLRFRVREWRETIDLRKYRVESAWATVALVMAMQRIRVSCADDEEFRACLADEGVLFTADDDADADAQLDEDDLDLLASIAEVMDGFWYVCRHKRSNGKTLATVIKYAQQEKVKPGVVARCKLHELAGALNYGTLNSHDIAPALRIINEVAALVRSDAIIDNSEIEEADNGMDR